MSKDIRIGFVTHKEIKDKLVQVVKYSQQQGDYQADVTKTIEKLITDAYDKLPEGYKLPEVIVEAPPAP
jgi:hypothetical protein